MTSTDPINGSEGDIRESHGQTPDEKAGAYFKERLLRDADKVEQKDIDELENSVPKKLGAFDMDRLGNGVKWINSMLDRVKTLYDMIRDRDYKLPRRKLTLIAAGLIYFVLPTDLTPDFIPGIGFIDDAVVLSMLWKMVREEVDAYLNARRRVFPE